MYAWIGSSESDAAEDAEINRYRDFTGRWALEGRGGASPTLDPSSLRGQVAAPAPIPFDPPSSSPVGAERGGFGRPSSPSGPDLNKLIRDGRPHPRTTNRPLIRARQAARLAAVGITSLALWRLISALLRRGN